MLTLRVGPRDETRKATNWISATCMLLDVTLLFRFHLLCLLSTLCNLDPTVLSILPIVDVFLSL